MKSLMLAICLSLLACAEPRDTSTGESTIEATDLRWMIGTWDCAGFSGYFDVKQWPGANRQKVVAVYTVSESQTGPGLLTGQYRELSTSDGTPLASFDESWTIDDFATRDKSGFVPATLATSFSNGGHFASSTGRVSGRGANGILGTSSFHGVVAFADGGSDTWTGNLFATSPGQLSANYRIGVAPGVEQNYHQLVCNLRVL